MFPITVCYETDKYNEVIVRNKKELANAVHEAWNYEQDIETIDGKPILIPFEDMENNDEWLGEFGLGLILGEADKYGYKEYKICDRETNEIYDEPWKVKESTNVIEDVLENETESKNTPKEYHTAYEVYVNETFEEEKLLYNKIREEVIFKGDYYHDKVDYVIQGYLLAKGLTLDDVEYIYINPNNDKFEQFGFYDDWE